MSAVDPPGAQRHQPLDFVPSGEHLGLETGYLAGRGYIMFLGPIANSGPCGRVEAGPLVVIEILVASA